jgi:hypothetical protein
MNEWAKIIAAVREPVSLAALGLLIFMLVLRTVVQKIEPVKGRRHGFELARTIVTYTAIVALVVAIVSIGYKTYELKAHSVAELKTIQSQETIELSKIAATQSKPPISRVGMETLLQKHRASIEECLQSQPKALYLDFALKGDADRQLNLDIFLGEEVGHIWAHPTVPQAGIFEREQFANIGVHVDEGNGPPAGDTYFIGGQRYPPRVTVAAKKKLSITYPKINGCILDVLRDSLAGLSSPETPFIHRYVTNNGIIKSREFPDDLDDKIREALEKGKFEDAESVLRHAKAIGFAISDADVVKEARALWVRVLAKEMNEEDYREALAKLLSNHIVQLQPEDR